MKPLTPPDKKRCQRMHATGCHPTATQFMAMGPANFKQCKNPPTVIVTEKEPGEDGRKGSMSLCKDCLEEFLKRGRSVNIRRL